MLCVLCFSDTVDEDDDLYDFVEDEENEGDEIYEDLMRTDEQPETVSALHSTLYLKPKAMFGLLDLDSGAVQKCKKSRVQSVADHFNQCFPTSMACESLK